MRKIALGLLLLLAPLPAQAAVTTNQLQTLVASITTTGVPYAQRIQYAMVLTAENVGGESAGTARHAERARFAAQVLNNPAQYVPAFAQDIAVQLPLASTNMVTVAGVPNADVDTSDATLQTTCSNIWNLLIPQ
jgi:hypothetical protein